MTLFRQAIRDVCTDDLFGYELMLAHPKDTLHLASASGTLLELDQFILRTAHSMANNAPHALLFVHVAPESLRVNRLPFAPEDTPSNLVLELTERGDFDETDVCAFLKPYREHGLRLALTDFGGRSNPFARYSALLPDYLKLQWTEHSDTVRAAATFAKNLHTTLIASHIETSVQAGWVRRSGIRYAQGFHYGKREAVAL